VWDRLVSAGTLRRLTARVPPDFASIDLLLPHLRGEALEPLFDVLVDSDDRHLRRAAFDRLRRTRSEGAARALARLPDDRWYVARNVLALLAEMERLPAECDPLPWLSHEDARVRREALRVALRFDPLRDLALSMGLADSDDRVLRLAVTAALGRPSPGTTKRLLDLAGHETLADDLRAGVVGALVRASREPDTLDLLLRVASHTARLLRRPLLAPKSQTVLAALAALAEYWPDDPRAAVVLQRAAASPDATMRLAAKAGAR
jgi:hypothetical protein